MLEMNARVGNPGRSVEGGEEAPSEVAGECEELATVPGEGKLKMIRCDDVRRELHRISLKLVRLAPPPSSHQTS
mgnify:CR=1 FL=1